MSDDTKKPGPSEIMLRVDVEGHTFYANQGTEEPRIRDVELGEWLGYSRPRNLRRLVKQFAENGDLPGILKRSATERFRTRHGGERPATVEEFYLTEEEALFIAAKSDTARGSIVLKELIRGYTAAKAQLRAPTPAVPHFVVDRIEGTPQVSAILNCGRFGDEPRMRDSLKRAIRSAARGAAISNQKVQGHLRHTFKAVSAYGISLICHDAVMNILGQIEHRKITFTGAGPLQPNYQLSLLRPVTVERHLSN